MSHHSPLNAVVLCGGLGTRLRSSIGDLPKPLASVDGHPFLHYVLSFLGSQGVRTVVLATGYRADAIADYCGDGARWNLDLLYAREETPLGTAGALRNAEPLLRSDPVLVLNADSMLWVDVASLVESHRSRHAQATIVVSSVPDRTRFGGVEADGTGAILTFGEKSVVGPGLVNAGVYLLSRECILTIPVDRVVSLEREVFPHFIGRGLFAHAVSGPFIDIGTPEAYSSAGDVLRVWFHGGGQ